MKILQFITIISCLVTCITTSEAKSYWEEALPITSSQADTSKVSEEAAAESRHSAQVSIATKKLTKPKSFKQKRVPKTTYKSKRVRKKWELKWDLTLGWILGILSLFTILISILAILNILPLWILSIFHFGYAVFYPWWRVLRSSGLVIFFVTLIFLVPTIAIFFIGLGLTSIGLAFFPWGAAIIGTISLIIAALILLEVLLNDLFD